MKKKLIKVGSVLLAAVVAVGTLAGVSYAKETSTTETTSVENTEDVSANEEASVSENDTKTEEKKDTAESLTTDDEVVYVFTEADGTVKKVKDSVWIENGEDTEQAADEADLPVSVKVTYTLDDKTVTSEELAGKSGHLVIRLDFEDLKHEYRLINGESKKVYVPFLAATMAVLDGEKFSNVEVSNGKAVYDGARYAVVGLCFPGLSEDLDLNLDSVDLESSDIDLGDKPEEVQEKIDDFEIPEYIEIEGDVTDCEITGMYLMVSNSVFSNLDIDTNETMDELEEDLDMITDAMDQLMDGSDQLYEGAGKLLDGANTLSDGITTLSDGLTTIDSNSDTLAEGAKTVFESLLAQASTQMKESGISVGNLTIDGYDDVLDAVLSQGCVNALVESTVTSQVKANEATITSQVTANVRANVLSEKEAETKSQIKAGILANMGGATEEDADAYYKSKGSSLSEAVDQMYESTYKSAVESGVDAWMASDEGQATIASYVASTESSLVKENMAGSTAQTAISEGNKKIIDLKASLDSYKEFYEGILAYTDGVGQAADGALQIKNKMPEFVEGVETLKKGTGELSDGLKKFDEEGIQKITEITGTTLEGFVEKLGAVVEVSQDYKAYDTDGAKLKDGVKFIYKIDSVK